MSEASSTTPRTCGSATPGTPADVVLRVVELDVLHEPVINVFVKIMVQQASVLTDVEQENAAIEANSSAAIKANSSSGSSSRTHHVTKRLMLIEELMARLEREQSKHAGHLDQRVQLALQLAVQLVCYFSKCSQISLKCGRLEIITFKIIEIP